MAEKTALLILEDGSLFSGESLGFSGKTLGEVVFNTAMTGYQEVLTDPSYAQQIITFTYPHIGNTGINTEDEESQKVWVAGVIVRNPSQITSNWRSQKSLQDYLMEHKIVGISGIDTRRLTRILREKGALRGCITTDPEEVQRITTELREFPEMSGLDLVKLLSVNQPYEWDESSWHFASGHQKIEKQQQLYHVVAYDFGVKRNLLRLLADRGCRITVVPAQTPADTVLAMKPDGVFLSNGPGDPAACAYAIEATRIFLEKRIPVLGICLGHQLLALASGAKTVKMKFGHHGTNHPVRNERTGQVFITSQNHGFAVDEGTLPPTLEVTHRSLFDQSLQGIRRTDTPAFGFQGHPEASPGPHDVLCVFDEFIASLK